MCEPRNRDNGASDLWTLTAYYYQGRIQDFHWEGGGGEAQKIMCGHAHYEREARSPLQPGSRARLWAPEALGVIDALSCYLSLILKHADTKWDKTKTYSIEF